MSMSCFSISAWKLFICGAGILPAKDLYSCVIFPPNDYAKIPKSPPARPTTATRMIILTDDQPFFTSLYVPRVSSSGSAPGESRQTAVPGY